MDETKLLLSRLQDLVYECDCPGYANLGFLNERECAVAVGFLNSISADFSLYGGYKNASRICICVTCEHEPVFPVTALKVTSKGNRELSHRDYLGSLMGLGIKRECVGDIITVSPKEAVIFVRNEIAVYVCSELNKVGKERVSVSEYSDSTDSLCSSTEELTLILTSMRIDCFVSSCINSSRSEATRLISSDMVFLNYLQVNKPSQSIAEGDVISIRGHGKYIIGSLKGKTRRDRLVINVTHYI